MSMEAGVWLCLAMMWLSGFFFGYVAGKRQQRLQLINALDELIERMYRPGEERDLGRGMSPKTQGD